MTDDEDVSNRRPATINKALKRAQSLGIEVDADPRFAELLENWANGHITMKEARATYLDHIREKDQARADWRSLGIASSIAKAKAAW
jgi:glutamate racemase